MKNSLYIFKWPLVALLFGFMLRVIAGMMKILNWQGGDIAIMITTAIISLSLLWLIIKLILLRKQDT